MARYYKYYRKDSSRYVKKLDKKYKRQLDSTWKSERKQYRLRKRLNRELVRKGLPIPAQLRQTDTLQKQLDHWYSVMNDTTISDSTRAVAKEKVKTLATERIRQYPVFERLEAQYHIQGDSVDWKAITQQIPGIDTLRGVFDAKPAVLFEQSEKIATQSFAKYGGGKAGAFGNELAQADELKNLPNNYRDKYGSMPNKDARLQNGKDAARDKLSEYIDAHPEVLENAQQKTSKLLAKYRVFDSANLSDAKKHSSLEGRTFFERLVVGGNFDIVAFKPISLDLSPELGFRITSKFFAGIGMTYRYTFGDTIRNSWYVSPRNTGFRVNASYDLFRNIYAYSEWNAVGSTRATEAGTNKEWVHNYFIGAGRKFLVHPKLYLTLTAMYNLNGQKENPGYVNRFQVRVGFQLSELAFRKKQQYYDPNR